MDAIQCLEYVKKTKFGVHLSGKTNSLRCNFELACQTYLDLSFTQSIHARCTLPNQLAPLMGSRSSTLASFFWWIQTNHQDGATQNQDHLHYSFMLKGLLNKVPNFGAEDDSAVVFIQKSGISCGPRLRIRGQLHLCWTFIEITFINNLATHTWDAACSVYCSSTVSSNQKAPVCFCHCRLLIQSYIMLHMPWPSHTVIHDWYIWETCVKYVALLWPLSTPQTWFTKFCWTIISGIAHPTSV